MKVRISTEEMAQAWELAADYLDFAQEWTPDGIPDDQVGRILKHLDQVIQPFLRNKAAIIRRNAKLGKRR